MSSGRFELLEKLSESATTSVYKAHHDVLERTVLLKILHKHLVDDNLLVERFKREARACALLRSDHIVQVYDLTEINGAPAIVMEYVDGTSLKDVLAAEGPLSAGRTRTIAAETLIALKAAHDRGVIHRDIKPGNILVTTTGRIKVTDFGLAAVSAAQTVTMEGAILGTPAYLPPEHIRGEAADVRSDLFSLGATLLEVNTGLRIFEGPTYSACIHNILNFDPARVDSLVKDERLASVIKKMMEPKRDQRYQSAAESLADVNAIGAAPDSATDPVNSPAGDRAIDAMAIAAAPRGDARQGTDSGHTAGVAASRGDARQGTDSVQTAGIETTRPVIARRVRTAVVAALLLCIAGFGVWMTQRSGPSAPVRHATELVPSQTDSSHGDRTIVPSAAPAESNAARRPAGATSPDPARQNSPARVQAESGLHDHAAKSDSSSLVVTCIPWAKVFLDSQYLGETPFSGTIPIAPGVHTVSFTNPQFMPIVKTVTAAPGARIKTTGNFFETAGYLIITVAPWAEVYVDDQYRDTTPMEKPIIVSAGKRTIRLHNPGFRDAVYEVSVPKKDTVRLSYSLTRIK